MFVQNPLKMYHKRQNQRTEQQNCNTPVRLVSPNMVSKILALALPVRKNYELKQNTLTDSNKRQKQMGFENWFGGFSDRRDALRQNHKCVVLCLTVCAFD